MFNIARGIYVNKLFIMICHMPFYENRARDSRPWNESENIFDDIDEKKVQLQCIFLVFTILQISESLFLRGD